MLTLKITCPQEEYNAIKGQNVAGQVHVDVRLHAESSWTIDLYESSIIHFQQVQNDARKDMDGKRTHHGQVLIRNL